MLEINNNNSPIFTPSVSESIDRPAINDKTKRSRWHFFGKLAQSILVRPLTTTVKLTYRLVKLLTWDPAKAGLSKVLGKHRLPADYLEQEYLKTVRAARDLLFIPAEAKSAFQDMVAKRENPVDDIERMPPQDYLQVDHTKSFDQFSSYLHGFETFEVIHPEGIQEFAATSDGSLNTVMASHFLKPDMMAINFGSPNVATFLTEEDQNGSIQTQKIDAKSLKRSPMAFHPTNGKIQSGIFFVPTNIPKEALNRLKEAAKKLEGRSDITCVNTNCRVLKEAGFSIEAKEMDDVVFPTTLMEHLLFRSVFYTDSAGKKHKVHFDILNTTQLNLEEYFEKIDMAVVGTRLRHRRRNADTEENRKARDVASKALIAKEEADLKKTVPTPRMHDPDLKRRKITVSVPSLLGDAVAGIWGRHTLYEVDLSDKREEISKAFKALSVTSNGKEPVKLQPFPQEKPSFATKLKRDLFFSGPMIRFLRRHMMGPVNNLDLSTQDLFDHLKSTNGGRLNYVVLDDKVVLSKVHANGTRDEAHRKAADWALSKHALLAGREEVYCSGELWYDKDKKCFMINNDSGTYEPSSKRVKIAAKLVNNIFNTQQFGNVFEVAATAA